MENTKEQKAVVKTPALDEGKKNITDVVLHRVNQFVEFGELTLPKDYHAGNALKAAWLILQEVVDKNDKPALTSCSRESIVNALFSMAVQGLNPMKRQCSFVAFGGKLTLMREYNGTIALAKRFGGVKEVIPNLIYEGDDFEYRIDPKTGRTAVMKHIQTFQNINDDKITGAYATVIMNDDTTDVEIMNIGQIRKAWAQGAAKGGSPAHKNFPGEMCKKTVISRACKRLINSSNDAVLGYSSDRDETDIVSERSRAEIAENANREEISFDEHEEVKETPSPEPVEEHSNGNGSEGKQQKIGPEFE